MQVARAPEPQSMPLPVTYPWLARPTVSLRLTFSNCGAGTVVFAVISKLQVELTFENVPGQPSQLFSL